MNESPQHLEYKGRSTRGQNWCTERHYSPWVALLLCAPGAACIAIYLAGDIIAKGFPFSGFFSLWLTAIATAIFSIFFYGRFPFRDVPWFVALNLFTQHPRPSFLNFGTRGIFLSWGQQKGRGYASDGYALFFKFMPWGTYASGLKARLASLPHGNRGSYRL